MTEAPANAGNGCGNGHAGQTGPLLQLEGPDVKTKTGTKGE